MNELRAQLREWRAALDRAWPWWPRALAGVAIVIGVLFPFFFSQASAFLNTEIIALAYVVFALGLNIVVGFAGLLDLGYVAFFALARSRSAGSLPTSSSRPTSMSSLTTWHPQFPGSTSTFCSSSSSRR